MSDEYRRQMWDGLYEDLLVAQDTAMRMLGDTKALPLYKALGDARRLAEELAPPGWSVSDRLGLIPMDRGV